MSAVPDEVTSRREWTAARRTLFAQIAVPMMVPGL